MGTKIVQHNPLLRKFKEKDMREVKYIWHYLCHVDPENMVNKDRQPSDFNTYIEDLNKYKASSASDITTFHNLKEAMSEYSRIRLEESSFSWIDTSNKRLCNWVWLIIKQGNEYGCLGSWKNQTISIALDGKDLSADFINEFSLPSISVLPKEQHESIVSFFDMINLGVKTKQAIMDTLRVNWSDVNSFSFKWLDANNKAQCEWAWEYINKSDRLNNLYKHKISGLLLPNNHKQQRDMTIAMFDAWPAIVDTKELFMRDMRKSWSQQKYRMKQTDKKSYSFLLKPETKAMLDEMAEKESMKQSEYLDLLIRSSYV